MFNKILGFLYFIFLANSVYAQHTISGKIMGIEFIKFTDLHIHIGQKTTTADASGNYSVSNLPSGITKVFIYNKGYQPIDTIIGLNTNLIINFKLKLVTNNLDEVVIYQKKSGIKKNIPEQEIKSETIEKYSNQSLGNALKEIPGIATLKTGSTVVKPIINGLYGSRVSVIYNNVKLEDQQWGTEHAPNFDINAAGRIRVIKGAFGLQYAADAIGGLVIIDPINVKKDTLFGKTILNLDSNGRGGSISSSIHKGNTQDWSWNALATLKYIGDKHAPNYTLSNTGNQEINFSGDIKYATKKLNTTFFYSYYQSAIAILSASHTSSINDLYRSINNNQPFVVNNFTYGIKNPKQEVMHQIGKLNFNYHFDLSASIAFQYAFQYNKRLEYDIRRGNYINTAALDLDLKTNTINIDFKKQTHDWNIKSGINCATQNNFANPATGVRPLIPNYNKTDFGFYGIGRYNFSDTFGTDTGIRYDFSKISANKYYQKSRWQERGYDNIFTEFVIADYGIQWFTKPNFVFQNISASTAIYKQTKKHWNFCVNASFASRNPNPSELFSDGLHHSSGVIELGDLNLKKEKSTKISATIEKKWKSFFLGINPYINFFENYIYLQPIGFETTIRGAFPVWQHQQAKARIAGIDIQSNWDINTQWQHTFLLAYVSGQNITDNAPLIDMPPLNFSNKITFSKKQWKQLVLELKSEMVCQQKQYPNNDFYTNIVQNNALEPVLITISTPPNAYHLLHFYSEIKFKLFKNINTNMAFSVQNIFNVSYRDYLNKQRFFADEIGRSIQLQLKFNY